MKTEELRKFIIDAYKQAHEINGFSSYIGYKEQLELIKLSKYYRKLLINKSTFTITCLDEDTNELVSIRISRNHSLKKVVLLLVAQNFYFTRQQIKTFINNQKP